MTKIDRDKIVRAVIVSAHLEGYKGSLKETTAKKAEVLRTGTSRASLRKSSKLF